MEPQKTPDTQNNTEQKRRMLEMVPSQALNTLQIYSNKNHMVLAQKQTYTSMEEN